MRWQNSLFAVAENTLISPQVYNTLCRIFPRRFVLPLSVGDDAPYDQNLNNRPNSTATSVRIGKTKVGTADTIYIYQHRKLCNSSSVKPVFDVYDCTIQQ